MSATTPKLVTLDAAGEILGVTSKSIRNYIAAGLLPAYRVGPKLLRVEESDVLALAHVVPTVGGAGAVGHAEVAR